MSGYALEAVNFIDQLRLLRLVRSSCGTLGLFGSISYLTFAGRGGALLRGFGGQGKRVKPARIVGVSCFFFLALALVVGVRLFLGRILKCGRGQATVSARIQGNTQGLHGIHHPGFYYTCQQLVPLKATA